MHFHAHIQNRNTYSSIGVNDIMEQKNRILWVDFSKGIVMLLVIVGHSSIPTILRGAIYSFHMPLFFLLSGYTTKCSETKQDILQRVKKTAKGLLLTAYLLWITRTLIYLLIGRVNYSLPQMIFSAIWAGGVEYEFLGLNIPAMGMTWFLVVLFILRNIYDVLQCLTKKHLTLISVCITFLGMLIGHWIQLPFFLRSCLIFVCILSLWSNSKTQRYSIFYF